MFRPVVLIVSSDERRRDCWAALVRTAGHRALLAATLQRALAWVRKIRPHAVLTDANLSDGPALTLLREMRAVPSLAHVPVLLLGGVPAQDTRFPAEAPDADLHPLEAGEAETAVAALLDEVLSGQRPHPAEGAVSDPAHGTAWPEHRPEA